MEGAVKCVIVSSAFMLVWISCAQATIRDHGDCPGWSNERHGYWSVSEKEGSTRCVLKCHDDYEPSGCHVLRRIGNAWNHPGPHCKEKSLVSVKLLKSIGFGVVLVVAAAAILRVLGFGPAGIVLNSFAASIQTAVTIAGSVFSLLQSAGAVGIPLPLKAGIVLVGVLFAYHVLSVWDECEAE